MLAGSELESWMRTLKVALTGFEDGVEEVAHQLHTPTDIVRTRLRWPNLPPGDASRAAPRCLGDSRLPNQEPETAKSGAFGLWWHLRPTILCTLRAAANPCWRMRQPFLCRPLPITWLKPSTPASEALPLWTTRKAAWTLLDIAGLSFPYSAQDLR